MLKVTGAARDRMLLGLRGRGLLLEVPCPSGVTPWRRDDAGAAFGLHIADAGLRAIGIAPDKVEAAAVEDDGKAPTHAVTPPEAARCPHDAARGRSPAAQSGQTGSEQIVPVPASPAPPAGNETAQRPRSPGNSKQEAVLTILRRDGGATIEELMHVTGWQAHSVRGFLAGTARKRLGLDVQSEKRDGERRYFLRPALNGGAING